MNTIRIFASICALTAIAIMAWKLAIHSVNNTAKIRNDDPKSATAIFLDDTSFSSTPNHPEAYIKPWFSTINGRPQIEFDHKLEKRGFDAASSRRHLQAINHGAIGKVTFRVIDDRGKAVPYASVNGGFYMNESDGSVISSMTDAMGMAVLQGISTSDLNIRIEKAGFYKTSIQYLFSKNDYNCVENGHWLPWNPHLEITLKPLRNPVPMYIKPRLLKVLPPLKKTYIGYDLEVADFVPPYGQGATTDFCLSYDYEAGDKYLHYRSSVAIAFTNAYDGIYKASNELFSELLTAYEVDTNARFYSEIIFEYDRFTGKIIKDTRLPINEYLVFRVRSKTDTEGNLISAHYGKIVRCMEADRGGIWFMSYFNPIENSRSLEAARDINLLNTAYKGMLAP